jgi:hypothetical protein
MTVPDSQNGNAPAPAPVPWALQTGAPTERATGRRRQMVQGLPAWDPLPPGEMLVQRHRRD